MALTQTNKKQLEAMGVDPSRLNVIPNIIDLQRFHSPKALGFRNQLNLSDPVLLYLGRLDWNKGLRPVSHTMCLRQMIITG